jgi:hypothetical protein
MVARLNATTDSQIPSVRHLLFLEREIFIFLSLLSGQNRTPYSGFGIDRIWRSKSGDLSHLRAATYLPVFLQHLKIIVRGIGRVGTRDDVGLLKQISENGIQLSKISGTPENQRSVVRTMGWIENVIRSITTANWHSA